MTSRVVIVTGASAGLGRAMALALLAAGHRVATVARTGAPMDELVREAARSGHGSNVLPVLADVTSVADCERAVEATTERFGRVDALINNAGASIETRDGEPFYVRDVAEWRAIVDTNFTAPFVLARLVVPAMVARGWGRVVNTVSSYVTMTRTGFTPYGPTKAALEAATLAWSAELGGTGTTVNAILPGGAADTRRVTDAERRKRSDLLPPAVMGPPIVWLMAPASDACTGMRIVAREWDAAKSDEENRRAAVHPAWSR